MRYRNPEWNPEGNAIGARSSVRYKCIGVHDEVRHLHMCTDLYIIYYIYMYEHTYTCTQGESYN